MNFRQADRRLFAILMIVFVQIVGAAMILPILPLYAQRAFGLSPQAITPLVSSFFVAQFLAGPYLGRLSDRHGRLPVLIVSQIGTAISFVMLGLAPNAAILFVARILDGITGGNIIVAQAYITDVTPREQRTQALGTIFAAFGIGFVIGPALGGVLSAAFGPRIPFLIAAAAAGLTALMSWFLLDETVTAEQREAGRRYQGPGLGLAEIAGNGLLALVLIVAFVGQFALGMVQATFALYGEAILFAGYTEDATNLGIGLLLAVVGLGQFITQMTLLPHLLPRLGDIWLVIVGTLVRGVGLLIFAMVASPWLAAAGSLSFAIGMGLMMPPLQSVTTHSVADELRGGVLGVFQSVVSLATIISTAIAGVLFAIHPTTPYWIGAAISAVVLLPEAALLRRLGHGQGAAVAAPVD